MFNLDKVKEAIKVLKENDQVELWNDYCDNAGYYDDRIEWNDIDELLYGLKPSEVLNRVDSNYSQNDDYAVFDGYGELCSFNYLDDSDSPFDIDALAQWIYENEDALGYIDEDDIVDHFDAISFVDNEMDDNDVEQFLISNDISFDEDDNKAYVVKDYLESLGDDVDDIVGALDDLGWLFDIEERVLQYFN